MADRKVFAAFIAALVIEGVEAEQIERAVGRVRDLNWGHKIYLHPLRCSFAWEQARRMERVL